MTYSLIARCPDTGQIGIGVQSHHLATGAKAPWLRSDAGVVATQAYTNLAYGAMGLELLSKGNKAQSVLDKLIGQDDNSAIRQVGMLDLDGNVAVHTGERCIGFASHIIGNEVAFMANMMAFEGVPDAMAASWEATKSLPFFQRILAALDSAEFAGGDIRGRQAASIMIAAPSPEWWNSYLFDLRVDDSLEPLTELRRLVALQHAYNEHDAGRLPGDETESIELNFWEGVKQANEGNIFEAARLLSMSFSHGTQWRQLFERLPAAELLTIDTETYQQLLNS